MSLTRKPDIYIQDSNLFTHLKNVVSELFLFPIDLHLD